MRVGEVEQEEFKVEIPFDYNLGIIVLKVNISGEEYDFILDTGAANVISEDLAKKLDSHIYFEEEVRDVHRRSSNLGFTKIEKLSIGDIDFLNTGAAIADLKSSEGFGSLIKVDGIIGSNLMRKAIWKIDYQNQIITITNSTKSLNIPDSTFKIPFSTTLVGQPIIDMRLNDITAKEIIVDTGSNGDFSLSKKTFDALVKNNPSIPQTSSFGVGSVGLYGIGKADSTHFIKVPSISFGEVSLENIIVSFYNFKNSIGNGFFKNYNLIINWFTKEITLVKIKDYNNSTLSGFGFSSAIQDNRLTVVSIFENIENLKLGDQILKIDEIRYDKLLPEQRDEIIKNGICLCSKKEISMVILRDDKELKYTLKRVTHL